MQSWIAGFMCVYVFLTSLSISCTFLLHRSLSLGTRLSIASHSLAHPGCPVTMVTAQMLDSD